MVNFKVALLDLGILDFGDEGGGMSGLEGLSSYLPSPTCSVSTGSLPQPIKMRADGVRQAAPEKLRRSLSRYLWYLTLPSRIKFKEKNKNKKNKK